ncbi:MAG: hypothetical protein KDD42_05360 [Bdellovibrionales bacterium]|nr:hypothetical protein [Bdellovibrionales bacterium]
MDRPNSSFFPHSTPSKSPPEDIRPTKRPLQDQSTTILSEVLRSIETELRNRGMLQVSQLDLFNPLWFMAETERNIFLWRRGLSLAQADQFEFWVEPHRLVEKRLKQLSLAESENPFTNPLWGSSAADPDTTTREATYLSNLLENLERIQTHAHALSCAARLVLEDFGHENCREQIVLPFAR